MAVNDSTADTGCHPSGSCEHGGPQPVPIRSTQGTLVTSVSECHSCRLGLRQLRLRHPKHLQRHSVYECVCVCVCVSVCFSVAGMSDFLATRRTRPCRL